MGEKYKFWAACTDLRDGAIVNYIKHHEAEYAISYRTFAAKVDLQEMRDADHPAMYRISCPDNWSISFHSSFLPTGEKVYYFAWSGIEHFFVQPDKPYPNEARLSRLLARMDA